jgi:hypothetical protein
LRSLGRNRTDQRRCDGKERNQSAHERHPNLLAGSRLIATTRKTLDKNPRAFFVNEKSDLSIRSWALSGFYRFTELRGLRRF